uniref:Secreted protein n=1 Tax=Panagrolaimus davidi TaxID=227884 RepID=A0A914QHP2_9BILA
MFKTSVVFVVLFSTIAHTLPILDNLGKTGDASLPVGGETAGKLPDLPATGDITNNLPTGDLTNNLPTGGLTDDALKNLPVSGILDSNPLLKNLPISGILDSGLLDALKVGDLLKCEKTLKLLRIQIDIGVPLS